MTRGEVLGPSDSIPGGIVEDEPLSHRQHRLRHRIYIVYIPKAGGHGAIKHSYLVSLTGPY